MVRVCGGVGGGGWGVRVRVRTRSSPVSTQRACGYYLTKTPALTVSAVPPLSSPDCYSRTK